MNKQAVNVGPCGGCAQQRPLQDSHMGVPRFVKDWLMQQPGSLPQLIGGPSFLEPQKIAQDVGRLHFLCQECETALSRDEGEFAEQLFHPINDSNQIPAIRYGSWMFRFCASVLWRAVIYAHRTGRLAGRPQDALTEILAAAEAWRHVALSETAKAGNYSLYLFPVLFRPSNEKAYELSVTTGVISGIGNGLVYAVSKLGRLFVCGGIIEGNEHQLWTASRIHADGGAWGGNEKHRLPPTIAEYLQQEIRASVAAVRTEAGIPPKVLDARRRRTQKKNKNRGK